MKKKALNNVMIEEKYDGLYYQLLATINLIAELKEKDNIDEIDINGLKNVMNLNEALITEKDDPNKNLLLTQIQTSKFILDQKFNKKTLSAVELSMQLLAFLIENL